MKIKYIGDHERIEMYGLEFIKNEPVNVSESLVIGFIKNLNLKIMAADKLKNNPDFKEVIEIKEPIKPAEPKGKVNGNHNRR